MVATLAASPAEAALVRAELRRRWAEEARQEALPSTVLAWAERHRQIEDRPFSLERFEPLRAIYEDDHPRIVIIKPAQRGVSEYLVNVASFALDRGAEVWTGGAKAGLNVGYIFPTKTDLTDFSKERISGLVEETDYLQAMFEDGDAFSAATFKQVGKSYLYLRGGWNARALKSFPADVILIDEYDEMDPKAPALARRRMNASLVRREIDVSTPTLPGVGIHALYLQSDRRVYEQRHACGAWVSFDFWRDVRVDGETYDQWKLRSAELIRASAVALHCPSCQAALTEEERVAPGRWRAEMPNVKGLRGYHVPWWPFPVTDLVEYAVTAVSQDPSELTELYRSDLGQPYESSGSRITVEMLAGLSHDLPGGVLPDLPWYDTTMGLDVGSRFHYRISSRAPGDEKRYVRTMGSVSTWEEVDGLMATYGVRLCVVDAFPEQHGARAFVDRHPGRAVTATYPTANALKGVLFAPDPVKAVEDGRVQVNRTMVLDALYAAVAGGLERWPAAIHNEREVIDHLTALIRVEAIDDRGQTRADWVHTKPDHLAHASAYDLVAARLFAPAGAGLVLGRARGI